MEAPVVSFLSKEEAEWVRFLNLREWWEKEGQTSYVEAVDHMVVLMRRFLDSLHKDRGERLTTFVEIAEEISGKLKLMDQTVVPNPQFSPSSDWTDLTQSIETRPFLFANIEGIAGMYASLARFLSGAFVRRLGRCLYCNGLFLAPDDSRHVYCPETDHQEKHKAST